MKYRRVGRSGLQVSEISLGSWLTLGSSVDQAATNGIVPRAFDLGINLFDTADVYAQGAAENSLREATRPYLRDAIKAAVNPSIATMATMGIVSLPGFGIGYCLDDCDRILAAVLGDPGEGLCECGLHDVGAPTPSRRKAFGDPVDH